MDKIEMPTATKAEKFEEAITGAKDMGRKATRNLLNDAGIYVGILIMIAVVVIMTTEMKIGSLEDIASLGLNFFLLLFCTYSMYISCSDSGMRHGRTTKTFTEASEAFDKKNAELMEKASHDELCDFCRQYIENELKETRKTLLIGAGIPYNDYAERWLGQDEEDINRDSRLTKLQRKAIIKANATMPIKLTPEMILAHGSGAYRRAPIGRSPEEKKKVMFGVKFITNLCTAVPLSIITFSVVQEPTLAMFASVAVKLLIVAINGFTGYKLGFENVVVDTANYMKARVKLMERAMQYVDANRNK